MAHQATIQLHPTPSYDFRQSRHEHLPKVPLRGCVLGPSGSGKGVFLVHLVLGLYRGCFERVYVFSPSVDIDHGWDAVKQYSEKELGVDPRKEQCFFSEWDESALNHICHEHAKVTALAKKQKMKTLCSILVIIDDWAESRQVIHSPTNCISSAFLRGRHQGLSIIVSSQKLTCLDPVIRVNATFWIVFRLNSGVELKALLEQFSAIQEVDVLRAMYDKAVADKHSFWYIDTRAPKHDTFWLRFDGGRMLVDEAWGSPRD